MEKWNSLVHEHMQGTVPPVLVRIVSQQGSAPRTAGARMLVLPESIAGTVGGGQCEGEAIAVARHLQLEYAKSGEKLSGIMRFSLVGIEDMDMICGGELCLLFEVLAKEGLQDDVMVGAVAAEKAFHDFSFVTVMHALPTPCKRQGNSTESCTGDFQNGEGQSIGAFLKTLPCGKFVPLSVETHLVVGGAHGENVFTTLPASLESIAQQAHLLDEPGFIFLADGISAPSAVGQAGQAGQAEQTERYFFADPFPAPHVVHIFGGGHVSKALADSLVPLGFGVVVLEDRAEFITSERFPHAKAIHLDGLGYEVIKEYCANASMGKRHAIVIMTRGHAHDRDVLAAALETVAGYVGMIGSKRKWGEVQKQLRNKGASQERLDTVHTPIGIGIGAETPEEIAVSIAAELIAWRRGTVV